MSMLGNAVVRREDPGFLTGLAAYVDALLPADALHLAYVRSPFAHARITSRSIDATCPETTSTCWNLSATSARTRPGLWAAGCSGNADATAGTRSEVK